MASLIQSCVCKQDIYIATMKVKEPGLYVLIGTAGFTKSRVACVYIGSFCPDELRQHGWLIELLQHGWLIELPHELLDKHDVAGMVHRTILGTLVEAYTLRMSRYTLESTSMLSSSFGEPVICISRPPYDTYTSTLSCPAL